MQLSASFNVLNAIM